MNFPKSLLIPLVISTPLLAKEGIQIDNSISPVAYPEVGYDQPLRPQFHFSSKKNWLNDPNGMVWDGEKFHLFFQHNPKSSGWGNMTWGHSTSPDMVHWTQHDHALLPYTIDGKHGTIFSGTAVMDHNNTLGLQKGDTPTMAAFYTFAQKPHKFFQAMAYSTDLGKTFTYHNEGRAVLPHQGFDKEERDPKVLWHEESKQWSMVLWVQRKSKTKEGIVRFFTSNNLTDWKLTSELKRDWVYECMDLVQLPVDGDPKNKKWVLYDASFDYEIGDFDGKAFTSDGKALKHQGKNYFAAQTFNHSPDGRSVIIGWMRGGPNSAKTYGTPHNQQMSFPSNMTLRTTKDGVRLFLWPIKEIDSLVTKKYSWNDVSATAVTAELKKLPALDLADIEIDFTPGDAEEILFDFQGLSLKWNGKRNFLECLQPGHTDKAGKVHPHRWSSICGPLVPRDGKVQLRLLIDRLSLEVFAFGGEQTGTMYYDPRIGPKRQVIEAKGSDTKINSLQIHLLKSAWK